MTLTFTEAQLKLAKELREKFTEQHGDKFGTFHPADVARLEKEDRWLCMVLKYNHDNVDKSVKHLLDIMKWRMENKVNDITEDTVDKAALEMSVWYPRYKSKQGFTIWWYFQSAGEGSMFKKPSTKEAFLCAIEYVFRRNCNQQILTVGDFSNGYHSPSSDLVEFGKFSTYALSYYYPEIVGKQLVVAMPFVYKFVSKIMLALVNSDVRAKIFYIKKDEVKKDIDLKYLPAHLGGTNTTHIKYVPFDTYVDETIPPLD